MAQAATHSAIVTELMCSARGDLILDGHGHLCTRRTLDPDTWADVPWSRQEPSYRLATISRDGWTLTKDGAQFILENCPPETARRRNLLSEIAEG